MVIINGEVGKNTIIPPVFRVLPVRFLITRRRLRNYNIPIMSLLTLSIILLSFRYIFGQQNKSRSMFRVSRGKVSGFARCANYGGGGDDDDGGLLWEGYLDEGEECKSAVFEWVCGV